MYISAPNFFNMKSIFIVIACLGIALHAQARQTPATAKPSKKQTKAINLEDRINRKTEAISSELSLSTEQQNKLHDLLLSRQSKIQQIRNGRKPQELSEEDKKNIHAIREEYKNEIKGILTAQQYEKWKQNRKNAKQRQQMINADPNMPDNKREPGDLD